MYAVIDWLASMFQSDEPCPCWKMKTTIPNAAAMRHTPTRRAHLIEVAGS
jgi:hypothetical protein